MFDFDKDLAKFIDQTLLRPDATRTDIEILCQEAAELGFYSVCVNSSHISQARVLLENTEVKVVTVAGFPLGAQEADIKRYEVEAAVDLGAHEVDVVLNLGRLMEGDDRYLMRELRDIVEAADEHPVKVIIETCILDEEHKRRACQLAADAGAHFVKTSTGFGSAGATVEDVRLMRSVVKHKLGVKAAGGIRDSVTARALLEAGANRLGTTAGPAIVRIPG